MTTEQDTRPPLRPAAIGILAAGAGDVTGDPAGALDRFLVDSRDAGGLVAIVEHTLAPGVLAAPLHRH